jgi:hypothetical protein
MKAEEEERRPDTVVNCTGTCLIFIVALGMGYDCLLPMIGHAGNKEEFG